MLHDYLFELEQRWNAFSIRTSYSKNFFFNDLECMCAVHTAHTKENFFPIFFNLSVFYHQITKHTTFGDQHSHRFVKCWVRQQQNHKQNVMQSIEHCRVVCVVCMSYVNSGERWNNVTKAKIKRSSATKKLKIFAHKNIPLATTFLFPLFIHYVFKMFGCITFYGILLLLMLLLFVIYTQNIYIIYLFGTIRFNCCCCLKNFCIFFSAFWRSQKISAGKTVVRRLLRLLLFGFFTLF